jgi:hypothetical protein
MKPMPKRLILQVFTNDKWNLSDEQLAQLREVAQLSIEWDGGTLVDFLLDRGPPKRDPAEHACLMRIAQGEADGVAIMQFPLFRGRGRKRSSDVLASQLEGPLVVLTAADLAARGLLPGGVVPIRALVDVARRAAELRTDGYSLADIAGVLNSEHFSSVHGPSWNARSVARLLRQHATLRISSAEPATL